MRRQVCLLALFCLYVLAVFAADTCPADCNGNGIRSADGICECNDGFTGELCQFQTDADRPGYCKSIGTSQFSTFAHKSFRINVAGVYYFTKATGFQAQIWTTPSAKTPSHFLTTGFYVEFGNTEVVIGTSNGKLDVTYNGDHHFPPIGQNKVLQLGNLQITTSKTSQHAQFVFQQRINNVFQSAEFELWPSKYAHEYSINIEMYLPATWEKVVTGLCDTFIAPKALANPVGSAAYIKSFMVPCNQVGFKDFKSNECKNPPAPEPVPVPCDVVREKAEEVCSMACIYAEQCIKDVTATCDLESADPHIYAYERYRQQNKYTACGGDWCNPCNGHGTCKSGKCHCNSGFTGAHCELSFVELECPEDCNGHGFCQVTGKCLCYSGWKGATCKEPAPLKTCPSNCNGRGECDDGVCRCKAGYYGTACQSKLPHNVQRSVCTASGDPHYSTFDNHKYSYQGHGIFYQVYSSELEIQAWHWPWVSNTKNLVQRGIAVRYHKDVVEVYSGDLTGKVRIKVNGRLYEFSRCFSLRGRQFRVGEIMVRRISGSRAIIYFGRNLQSYISVSVGITGCGRKRQLYLNTVVSVDRQFFGQIGGLCGTWDGIAGNVFTPRGHTRGISLTNRNLYEVFGPSWYVDCKRSLFSEAPPEACSVAPSPIEAPLPAPCEQIEEIAEEVCKQACTQYAECVHDVRAACDATVANLHIDLHKSLQNVWEGKLCTEEPPVCMNDCSGNGVCVSNGNCHCNEGYTGIDCSVPPCKVDCGAHGVCNVDKCCCHDWWTGEACSVPVCKNGCTLHGKCVSPDKCQCHSDATNGFWQGEKCDQCQDDYEGPGCHKKKCPNNCSGHGTCDHHTGKCTCDNNWSGKDCNTFAPNLNQLTPIVDCRMPGPDLLPGSTGGIYFGYTNVDDIVMNIPAGEQNNLSPPSESVVLPTSFPPGQSTRYPDISKIGFFVPFGDSRTITWTLGIKNVVGDINTPLCQGPPCPKDCSNNGACYVGNCVCEAGAAGIDCSQSVDQVTPSLMCVINNQNSTTTAYFSYDSENNDTIKVPVGDLNKFSGPNPDRGQPTTFVPGQLGATFAVQFDSNTTLTWTLGPHTAVASKASSACVIPCPNDCSNRGRCVSGVCDCPHNYGGIDCSIPIYDTAKLTPLLKCVSVQEDGSFLATFGFLNNDSVAVHVPAGTENGFSPDPVDRGQPTTFAPGLNQAVFSFTITEPVVWKIGTRSAMADPANTNQRCPIPCPNNCSGHGTCDTTTGTCSCAPTYGSVDCSIDYDITDVTPFVSCVKELADGSYVAYFGYHNIAEDTVYLPEGAVNQVVPKTNTQPIPQVFFTGTQGDFPDIDGFPAAFTADAAVKWTLGTKEAIATSNSPSCPAESAVMPIAECVQQNQDGSYTGKFGYYNPNDYYVTIDASENYFTPPVGSPQPTRFTPGRNGALPDSIDVTWDGQEPLVWTLGEHTATIITTSEECPSIKPPAPVLNSIVWSDNLATITVSFNGPTNRAGMQAGVAGPCDNVFDAATVATLGTGATCVWVGDVSVQINLGLSATVLPGDQVTLGTQVYDPSGESAASGSIEVSAPVSPQSPTAHLSGPSTVSVCDTATFSAIGSSGGGGRPLKYTYVINSAPSGPALNYARMLAQQQTGDTLVLDHLSPGVYIVVLRVTNFIGSQSAVTANVIVQPGNSVISLSLDTPAEVTVTKGVDHAFSVTGTANFACAQNCEEPPRTVTSTTVFAQKNSLVPGQPIDSGMVLASGDHLNISVPASSKYIINTHETNAGGLGNPYGPDLGTYTDPISGQSFRVGALVGRIGTGSYFLVGTTFDGTVSDSGSLRLIVWNQFETGNSGSVSATITIQPKPNCPAVCEDIPPTVVNVKVAAQSARLDAPVATGLTMQAGQVLQISAPPLAMWHTEGPDNSNAGGLGNPYGTPMPGYRDPVSGQMFNYGSLVGRIGNGPYFFVGTEYQSTVAQSGSLVLVTWDSNYNNNFGDIPVTVTVTTPQTGCVPPVTISYQWTTPFGLPAEATNKPSLVVPLDSIAADQTYSLELTAFKTGDSTVFSTATVSLNVVAYVLSVSITGAGTYNVDSGFTVAASTGVPCTFAWSCMMNYEGMEMPCISADFSEFIVPSQSSFSVSPYQLLTAQYTFVVTATSEDGHSATASAHVVIVPQGVPISAAIMIQTPSTVVLQGSTPTQTASSKFAFTRPAIAPVTTTWSLISGQLLGSAADCFLTTTSQPQLAVNSSCLQPGGLYIFRYATSNQIGVQTNATVVVRAASTPSGGILEVSPSQGSTSTDFTLHAAGFTTKHGPMRYSFSYFGKGVSRVLQFPSSATEITNVRLPAGTTTVQVTATDATGAQSTVSINVNVAEAETDDSTYRSALHTLVTQIPAAMHWQNYHRVGKLISKVVIFLNNTNIVPPADQERLRSQLLDLVMVISNATGHDSVNTGYLFTLVSSVLELPGRLTAAVQAQALSVVESLVSRNQLTEQQGHLLIAIISQVLEATPSSEDVFRAQSLTNVVMHNVARHMISGQRQNVMSVDSVSVGVAVVQSNQLGHPGSDSFGPNNAATFTPQIGSHLNVDSVQVRSVVYSTSPLTFARNNEAVVSGATSISLHDSDGNEIQVTDVDSITIKIVAIPHEFQGQPQCRWYNNETNSLDEGGCTYDYAQSTSTVHVCQCTHLTSFVVVDSALITRLTPGAILLIACSGAALLGLLFLVLVAVRIRRQRAAKANAELSARKQAAAQDAIALLSPA